MSITIRSANPDFESWNDCIARSPQATPFHQEGGLRLLEDHTGATLHPLIGYKGEQPIGVLPVFETQRGPFTVVMSPPTRAEVYYLGPVLANADQLKQRKYENRNRRFIEAALEWLDQHVSPDYSLIRTTDRYTDNRPFKSKGYEITPYYTYVVDLSGDWDDLIMEFSSDARSNIRNTDEAAYEIEVGTFEDAKEIIARVDDRHEEQGESYYITDQYVAWLFSRLEEGQVKPYVCRTDDGMAGGILTLELGDTIYRWQGGTKVDAEIPVNDLLDGYVMRDAMDRGLARYDLVGANTQRICDYKSKFAPDLRAYYGARRRSRSARIFSTVKQSLPIDV